VRAVLLTGVFRPLITHYVHPRLVGAERLRGLAGSAVLAATHASHLDTPLLLSWLPWRIRRRTAVVAAADYFFRRRWVAVSVSLAFATVPIERERISPESLARVRRLLDDGWHVLVFPEGTRSRTGVMGPLRRGAAAFAISEKVPLVPVYVRGTHEAMPVGARWVQRRVPVTVVIGDPLWARPGEGATELTDRLAAAYAALAQEAGAGG
jgi:1-acyl-sn-glycerol-3-phosphate acyltransferase